MAYPSDSVLGVDPTAAKVLGLAWLSPHGAALGVAAFKIPPKTPRELARDLMAAHVRSLIAESRPRLVAIEIPVLHGKNVGEFGIGAAAETLNIAMTAGRLEEVARAAGIPVVLVNPGLAKLQAVGSIVASKQEMIRAARIRLAEFAEDHTTVRQPLEHEADALFIGLAGLALARESRFLELAKAQL